jgi:Domain of unknown function (DUF4032)
MPMPSKLDQVIERVPAEGGSENQELRQAAGLSLSPMEAREVWPQVLEHKWYMSERLGRDVGLRAAAIDYFTNVRRVSKRDEMREMPAPTLPFMRPFGYR